MDLKIRDYEFERAIRRLEAKKLKTKAPQEAKEIERRVRYLKKIGGIN